MLPSYCLLSCCLFFCFVVSSFVCSPPSPPDADAGGAGGREKECSAKRVLGDSEGHRCHTRYSLYYAMLCYAVLCCAVLCCVLYVENSELTSSPLLFPSLPPLPPLSSLPSSSPLFPSPLPLSSSPLLFIIPGADKQTGHAEGRDNQLSKLEDIFQRFDVDGSNGLSAGELRNGLAEDCGLRLGDEDFQRLLNVVDSDHNGTVTFNGFTVCGSRGATHTHTHTHNTTTHHRSSATNLYTWPTFTPPSPPQHSHQPRC